MAGLGNNQYWERADPALVSDDEPLTAFNAWLLRENEAHLISSFPQYRVNWQATSTTRDVMTQSDGAAGTPVVGSWAFPLTVPEADRSVSLDVRVGALVSGSVTLATYRARVVWDIYPVEASTAASTQPTLFEATGTSTSTTGDWPIDTQDNSQDASYRQALRDFTTSDEGTSRTVRMAMARLDIIMDATYSGSGTIYAVAAQVREYV